MNHPVNKRGKAREAMPNLLIGEPDLGFLSMKAAAHEETLDPRGSAGPPASPLMLTPRIAWRRFCAATGGRVGMRTFYQWIGNEEIYSVRTGRKLLIPAEALDNLINLMKQCLAGGMLTPRLALARLCKGTCCRVCMQTFYMWIAAYKIRSFRVGGRIFIPVTEVDELIEKCLAGDRLY
jgi:excisionase family DNA binding protein